jgi:ABC-type transport system involved in cytochrome c biogenesis permease subunit
MATDAPSQQSLTTQEADEQLAARRVRAVSNEAPLLAWLMPLASLKFTVALFVAAIFLVFAGTMAQVDMNIERVVAEYFRTPIAWVPFQIFFPQSFTGAPWHVPGGIYFPGGFTIGALMGINLLAAHALRFKVQSSGTRLLVGLAVIAVGAVLTWLVVVNGSSRETVQNSTPVEWSTLWKAMKWSLVGLWGLGAYAAWKMVPERKIERWLLIGGEAILGCLLVYMFWMGERVALGDSSMRILWQLLEGGFASLVLLVGCMLVFRKRAGIVLLHAGIMLVMANELVVYFLHYEHQMQVIEGQTVDYAYDVRALELAVIDTSDEKTDRVTVVPEWMLEERSDIRDQELPFDIEVVKFYRNSTLGRIKPDEKNLATKGFGTQAIAEPRKPGTGTDTGGKVDMSAAYLTLLKKGTKEPLGTYLVGIAVPEQQVELDGKKYDVALRFQRHYKPYSVTLLDVRADMYPGTNTPKNYSSDIHLVDKSRNVDTDEHIWMNNPLRYGGETFYQQSYDPGTGGREITVLSIVRNTGWMIPYVACMIVGTGMLAQFGITLMRFLRRRDQETMAAVPKRGKRPVAEVSLVGRLAPAGFALAVGLVVLGMAWPRSIPTTTMKLDEFGRLPVVYDGRVKPIDSLARGALKNLSGRETFRDAEGKKQPAVKWFLDSIARPDEAYKHPVIQIYNLEVLEMLGLQRREGFRYAIDEFVDKIGELDKEVQHASKEDLEKLTIYQRKLLELARKLETIQRFQNSFELPPLRKEHLKEDLTAAAHRLQMLDRMQLPRVVPPKEDGQQWESFAKAGFEGIKDQALGQKPNEAMISVASLLIDYSKQDAKAFNDDLAKYQAWLGANSPVDYHERRVNFEAFYNSFSPLFWACWLYVLAFVLAAFGWLGWTGPLNRAAFWMVLVALAFHTFGLIARIYISGRPPVTNLYSSAVFIGWGGVLLGLLLERIYRLGVGNVIAAVAGFLALAIAIFGLDDGGDTLGVLQAVLDTQFWLATHVVCVTLGYSTTFIAGLLGLFYILRGAFTPSLSPTVGKDLARMIYGTVCFAIFFSFVGTVLGGLWADDSWGRFWGWDPKENGALMIVIWNALILHARWGGLVKQRGLAALAIGGNIVTAWSWFGVNELGVGLHSYGFTEGVLRMLLLFVISQLAVISLAMLPRTAWWSARAGHAV